MKTKNAGGPSVYASLRVVDRRFRQILRELDRLQQLKRFRGVPPIKAVNGAVKEMRAWTMVEILDVLREREESEWMRLGSVRDDLQTRTADPTTRALRSEGAEHREALIGEPAGLLSELPNLVSCRTPYGATHAGLTRTFVQKIESALHRCALELQGLNELLHFEERARWFYGYFP